MLAVLEDAFRTLLLARYGGIPRRRVLRELAWIESTSRTDPFAFESICDVLDIDAARVRGRVVSGSGVPERARRERGPRTPIRRSTAGGAGHWGAPL